MLCYYYEKHRACNLQLKIYQQALAAENHAKHGITLS